MILTRPLARPARRVACGFAAVAVFALAAPALGRAAHTPYYKTSEAKGSVTQNFVVFTATPNTGGPQIACDFFDAATGNSRLLLSPAGGGSTDTTLASGAFSIIGRLGGGEVAGIAGGAVAGIVVARTVDNSPALDTHTGVFLYPTDGSAPTRLSSTRITDPTFAPAASPNGNVVFKDLVNGSPVIYVRSAGGGNVVTISGSNFSQIGRPAISTEGNVAFIAQANGSVQKSVYVQFAGQSAPVAIGSTADFNITGDEVNIIDTPQGASLSFFATDTTGATRLAHSDQFTSQGVAHNFAVALDPAHTDADLFSVALVPPTSGPTGADYLSRKGYDAWKAHSDTGFVGPQNNPYFNYLGDGSNFNNSRVSGVVMSDTSLQADGSAFLYVALENGDNAFYRIEAPEPVSLSLIAAPLALLRRRRRRDVGDDQSLRISWTASSCSAANGRTGGAPSAGDVVVDD